MTVFCRGVDGENWTGDRWRDIATFNDSEIPSTVVSEYTLSPSSQRDLVAAALYAAKKAGTPKAGDRVIQQLGAVMETLAQFPTMGRAREELRPRLRSFPSNPFIIFYQRTRTGVHVHRILHQRQDVEAAFPGRPAG